MKKKTALITGSTSGIGLGVATYLAAQGWNILLHGLSDAQTVQGLIKNLESTYKVQVGFSGLDLSVSGAGQQLIDFGAREFGTIELLVNNAGIQHVSPIESFPPEKWEQILAINLSSAFQTIRAVLPMMRKSGWGRIVNIASVHGLVASVHKSAYVSAKHGLVGLTKAVALETAGSGVTCNAICPGWVKTPLVMKQVEDRARAQSISESEAEKKLVSEKQPSGTFVTSEQIAALVAYLASDLGGAVTGASIPIDGGWTAQ